MEYTKNGSTHRLTFHDLDEWIEHSVEAGWDGSHRRGYGGDDGFFGGVNHREAAELASNGWRDGLTEAMPIAEEAVETIEDEITTPDMQPYYDVTGGEVDVGRYVQGVPECMVDYKPVTVSKAGKVVTLCASICYSQSLSEEKVMRRGAAITALALALERSGHETEIWADASTRSRKAKTELRVKVKGPGDVVDPERIAYIFAHPSSLRHLVFGSWADMEYPHSRARYKLPADPAEDLPDGTIYLPSLTSKTGNVDPQRLILEALDELGLRVE